MSDNLKPMLAGKAPADLAHLRYPVMVSPKLDGVRALVLNGVVVSRNLLPIPCPTVQSLFGHKEFNGLDGELILGDPTAPDAFRRTSSAVTAKLALTHAERAQLRFHVFDNYRHDGPFIERFKQLSARVGRSTQLVLVPHEYAVNTHAVELHEQHFVDQGYEGLMIRDPLGSYKHGRSTTKEGGLLKLKRFEDAEAVVCELKELQHNKNMNRTGGLAQRRSSRQAGKEAGGVLGAFSVRGLNGPFKGVAFDVGTGFTADDRNMYWQAGDNLVGLVIKYRYFPGGSKDKPRFPVFLGFRNFKLEL